MRKASKEFLGVYNTRPIKESNMGGMMLPHLFATWYMLKQLDPAYIIESGIFRGLGTWVMEQACPNAKITSIDINLGQRKYISQNVFYEQYDITEYDWRLIGEDCVIHFDDHQNALDRVTWAKDKGFKHLIFEDNYPEGIGDCVSLKQHPEFIKKELKEYIEFPPVYKDSRTRWQTDWNDGPAPLYKRARPLNPYWKEALSYTWICYARIC